MSLGNLYKSLMASYGHKLGIDGCTAVSEWMHDACVEHDIHYRTGRTWYVLHGALKMGTVLTRKEADDRYYTCQVALGGWKWRARARWLGVRVFLWPRKAWDGYRENEQWPLPDDL